MYIKERKIKQVLVLLLFMAITVSSFGISASSMPKNIDYLFTVSMDSPNRHYIHVEMTCRNQKSDFIDLKMPVWTPGYYGIQNNSKHLTGFKATNQQGTTLSHSKTSKNTWRVNAKNEKTVIVSYDVYAAELSVVGSFLDASKAFISPTSVYLFPSGQIEKPSVVTFNTNTNWKNISTGLEKIDDKPNSFFASDFDVLFDCPTLIGNHKIIPFEVKGVPHTLAISEKDTIDKSHFIADLTKIIETATSLMGDIPYKHYSFITIGSHGGGMEHSNSCALSCSVPSPDTSKIAEYKDWLAFVTHEYFHLFNVKRIRPVTLGPFDYDRECYTNMLWVSEGFTVYYEYLILNRAGIFTKADCYEYFTKNITGYENRPGHLMESATSSGFDAWIHFFERNAENRNNTISYYDKGCALGLMLDLKIRAATTNQKSLDDVMRTLYNTYHIEKKRGFTDDEFRSVCERTAGTSLDEIFTYASTVNPIDYPKYLSLAGLSIDTTSHVKSGEVYFGAKVQSDENHCWLSGVERNSPAWNAGLGNDIEITNIEGQKATKEIFDSVLKTKKPDDTLQLTINVDDQPSDVKVVLLPLKEKSFKIEEDQKASEQEKFTLNKWLK